MTDQNSGRVTDCDTLLTPVDFLDKIKAPKYKQRGTPLDRLTITIYDRNTLERVAKWARQNDTNMSALIYHTINHIEQQIAIAEGRPQQLITAHMSEQTVPEKSKVPRLDDPTAVWLEWLSGIKTSQEYELEVETHLRKIIHMCNAKYEELAPCLQ